MRINPVDTIMYDPAGLVTGGAGYFAPFIKKFLSDSCQIVYLDTIPGATDAALASALQLGYHPQWIISSVGSDPVTVAAPFAKAPFPDPEIGALTFTYLPTSTATNPWNAWMRKVLLADKADFPSFTAATPIDGNMAYGVGWGVAFAGYLKAAGRNFTRASFLKVMNTTTLMTPALQPLRYSQTNHQGLTAGYIVKVASASTATVVDPTVYTTSPTAATTLTKVTKLSMTVPAWLH